MPFATNKKGNKPVDLYFEDYGKGKPVILIHGWPLSHKAWEGQVDTIVDAGFRCVTYDRRGFGRSTRPWEGYDYSSLASDLDALITGLDLKECTLVGFSMGGGEVVRYLTDFGTARIEKVALVSSIIPLVAQKPDNPEGVPEEDLKGILGALKEDRLAFLKDFGKGFYNYDKLKDRVNQAQLDYDWSIAANASPRATLKTAEAWAGTDFRPELKNVTVPTLIVHGDDDQTVPMVTAGKQAAEGIKNNRFEIIKGAPHGLNVTHKDKLNKILLEFLQA